MSPHALTNTTSFFSMTLLRTDDVIFEITGAVGFRPQTDAAVDRWAQNRVVLRKKVRIGRRIVATGTRLTPERVLERKRSIEKRLQTRIVDLEFQFVPGRTIEHKRLRSIAEPHVAS